ncbi:MAG: TVP38/TMEM64 family protein [Cyanobacteria bacterium J06621_3]
MTIFRQLLVRRSMRSRLIQLTLCCLLGSLIFAAGPAWAQEAADQASGPFAQLSQGLERFVNWIETQGWRAPFIFILAYIAITVAFLPASVVTLGAGAAFGWQAGALYVFIGAMLGATAAFLIGRFVARDWIAQKVADKPFFKALDNAIAEEGLKLIFLIRLSPAFPFNLLNYALGLTKVSLKDYVIGTTGIIPGTIMYVYLGFIAREAAMLGDTSGTTREEIIIKWVINILLLVTIVAISLYIAKIAKKALNQSVPAAEEPATDLSDMA